ncbi:cupin-like domain-containing protein [Leptolyngbya sp. NK1-12]|uniref:Cupin-like domain-containing protein n=1 Tax=Leptolyngbya sp. NK1-12 TaxID=2547451 RepID=A0AA97AID8_9CYAN|nr:cupin-like domain-containing protein [Leptolyngbya sp. NK1-12]WNZ23731.1 cupin-like domain-containing protein [Leptolyngbya sp. NK1-12]
MQTQSDLNPTVTHLEAAALAIERISFAHLTAANFAQRYQKRGIPVIITDLLQPEWDWNLDYLCQQLGEQKFLLRYYGKERYQQDKREWTSIGSGVQTQSQSFTDYAELLRNRTAHEQDIYLAKCSLQETPLADTEAMQTLSTGLARLGLQQPASSFNLWVGPAGHMECLHYDAMDGTLVQLHGSKRVVLFPPGQTFNLYPYPFYAHLWHGLRLRSWFSRVYPDRPDFEAFPKLRQALQHKYEVILQPGEVLYIPAGWWHEVTSLSDELGDEMVCSVNRFWRVYPTPRAVWLWGRWRAYLGSICAIPHVVGSLALALVSRDRKQKVKEILQML